MNIGGTLNVLLAAREHGVRRVVYASSASVYGNPRYLPINEDDGVNALTPYSVSKFAGESYCKAFYESYDLPTTGCGTRTSTARASARQSLLRRGREVLVEAHAGRPITIHGDGEQTRDFTYVDDAVEATLLAADDPRAEGQVYNVGTGARPRSTACAASIGRGHSRPSVDPRHIDRRDIDNIRRRVLNIEKSRRELRWVPAFTLRAGLRRTYEWSVESRDGSRSRVHSPGS